jgi:hypothetical protein
MDAPSLAALNLPCGPARWFPCCASDPSLARIPSLHRPQPYREEEKNMPLNKAALEIVFAAFAASQAVADIADARVDAISARCKSPIG